MPSGSQLEDTARRQPASREQHVQSAPADRVCRRPAAFARRPRPRIGVRPWTSSQTPLRPKRTAGLTTNMEPTLTIAIPVVAIYLLMLKMVPMTQD